MKANRILFTLTLLLSVFGARAEEVSHYLYDFNSPFGVTDSRYDQYLDHNVAPPGWWHIVDGSETGEGWYTDIQYVRYYYYGIAGIGLTGSLYISSQTITVNGQSKELYDCLVTPQVKGKVSVWAKEKGSLQFYTVTKDAKGNFVRGDEITPDSIPELSRTKYGKYVINNVPSYTYIGIRGSDIRLDNFEAEHAILEREPRLVITDVKSNMPGRYHDVDADGNYTVSYNVGLRNVGLVDLTPGYKDYSLSLLHYGDTVGTEPISGTLAQGKDTTVVFNTTINIAKYPAGVSTPFDVKENISGNVWPGSYVSLSPHEGIFALEDGNNSDIEFADGDTLSFGTSADKVSQPFYIENHGGSQLKVNSISLPDGFTTDVTMPLNVAPHERSQFNVVMDNATPGAKSGQITFDHGAKTTLNVNGYVADKAKYFVDFEDDKFPITMAAGTSWSVTSFPYDARIRHNHYSATASSGLSYLITPKLRVENGEALTIDAGRGSANIDISTLNIYYSKDRSTWTLARSLSNHATGDDAFSTDTLKGYDSDVHYYKLKKYTVSNIPAGEWYIAFQAGNVNLDNIAGFTYVPVAHNIAFTDVNIPTQATVNKATTIKVTLKNANDRDEAAGSYKAGLFVDGKLVATNANTPKIASGASADISISYTPHYSGKQTAYVGIILSDDTLRSDASQIDVSAETDNSTVQAGKRTFTATGNLQTTDPPVAGDSHYSESELVYTPEQLDLLKGAKIKRIVFKGKTWNKIQFDSLNVYIANTSTGIASSQSALSDTTAMTKIHDDDYLMPDAPGPEDEILSIDIPDGFVYTGQNLRLVFTSHTDNTVSNSFVSTDVFGQTLYRFGYQKGTGYRNSDINTKTFQKSNYLPVMWLDIEQKPSTLSGTITAADGGKAIAGAKVVLTSDNVEYSGTTGTDGKYSIEVYQPSLRYAVNITATGYEPVKDSVEVSQGDKILSKSLNAAAGLYVQSADIAAKGTVNHAFEATADVLNPLTTDVSADSYTATLYVEGKALATATTQQIASGSTATLSFRTTPHEVVSGGKAYVVVEYNGKSSASDTVVVDINPESTHEIFQAGDSTFLQSSMVHQPISTYYRYSESEILFPVNKIYFPKGAELKSVSFHGRRITTLTDSWTARARIYLENTDDGTPEKLRTDTRDNAADTTAMTKVYDGDLFINTQTVDTIFAATFTEPFTYTGKALRMVIAYDSQSDNYVSTEVVVDTNEPYAAFSRYADSNISSADWHQDYLPVAWFDAELNTTLSGHVADIEGNAISGATVTLRSGDVLYTGTTDSNGDYTVRVVQSQLPYVAEYSADGYTTQTVSIAFNGESVEKDVTLAPSTTLGVTSINASDGQDNATPAAIYGVDGSHRNTLSRGINIIRHSDGTTHKVVVK